MTSEDDTASRSAKREELAALWQRVLARDLAETTPEEAEPTPEELAERRRLYEHWETAFGEKVRQWRRARNWSQEDLAERLRQQGFEMHQTTVAKIERGTRPLRVAEAAAIATIFRVPPLAVFLGPPPEKTPWSLEKMHETLRRAQQIQADFEEMMIDSAERYIKQTADVIELARMLNDAALKAETRTEDDQLDAYQGESHAPEA
jgi:transcriptional regulator with XRE-family HTH domain